MMAGTTNLHPTTPLTPEGSAIVPEYVPLSDLAAELNLDRSTLRKYVLKHGFHFTQMRTSSSRGQLALFLTAQDADTVRQLRERQGFAAQPASDFSTGYFYVIQSVPDLDPLRVKLGTAVDPIHRLEAYRTLSPNATIVRTWPCHPSWEPAAIASMTRTGCQLLGGEVYACDNLEALIDRGDAFFALLP